MTSRCPGPERWSSSGAMLADPGNPSHTSSCSPGTRPRGHRTLQPSLRAPHQQSHTPCSPLLSPGSGSGKDTSPVRTTQPTHKPVQGSQASPQRPCLFINSQAAPAGTREGPGPRPLGSRVEAGWPMLWPGQDPGETQGAVSTGTRGQALLTTLWPSESGGLRTAWPCSGSASCGNGTAGITTYSLI